MRDHRQWQIPETPHASKISRGWFYQLQGGQIISRRRILGRPHKREPHLVEWKQVTQQPQHAETSRKLYRLIHESEPGIEIEDLSSEERRFFGCINEYQSCHLIGMVVGVAADNEATVGVRYQNVRFWDTCVGEQSVEFFGAFCNCASRCNRIAPAVAGSIVGTNAGELGDSILDWPPKARWLTCPLFDNNGRADARLVKQVKFVVSDGNDPPGRGMDLLIPSLGSFLINTARREKRERGQQRDDQIPLPA